MTQPNLPEPMVPAALPTSRAAAVERGAVRYFTGQPCPHGHAAPRYTLNGYCVTCQALVTRASKAAIKSRRAA